MLKAIKAIVIIIASIALFHAIGRSMAEAEEKARIEKAQADAAAAERFRIAAEAKAERARKDAAHNKWMQEQVAAIARADAEHKRIMKGSTEETPPKDPNDKMRNGEGVKRFANADANSEFWYMIDAKANKATGRVVTLIYSAPSKTCKGWSYLENKQSCFEMPEFWRRDEIDCKTGHSRLIGEYMKLREVQAPFTASKRFEPIGEYKVQRTVRGMVCQ